MQIWRWSSKGLYAGLAAVATVALLSACGSSSSSSGSGSGSGSGTSKSSPFSVVMVADTSGPTKVYGTVDVASMKGAAAYWNAHGGILGHRIQVTVLDDNGDQSTAVSVLTQYLTSHGRPSMVFPGTSGVDSGGLISLAKRDKLLAIGVDDGNSICATNAQTTCPTAFRPGPPTKWEGISSALWFKQHHISKVGILQEDDAFSESETPGLESSLKADGIGSTVASFPSTSVNVQPEISELKSAGAKAIFAEALGAPAGFEAAGREQLGLVNSMPLVFDPGAASLDLTTLAHPSALKNAYEVIYSVVDPYQKWPGRDLMIKSSKPFGGITSQPLNVAAFQWQDLLMVHDAAAQAGSIDPTAISQALEKLPAKAQSDPLNTTARVVSFTSEGHEDTSSALAHDYEVVPVGPLVNGMVKYKK
jgi:branched-chain amino acid transport system substrate-binding protein